MSVIRNIRSSSAKVARVMSPKRFILSLVLLVAVGGVAGSIYFQQRYQDLKENPNASAEKESSRLIEAIGKLIELPTDETPSVVTIVDTTKLSDQPFFNTAANGDILLAYINSKEAILYRPSSNKIIQVASINVNQNTTDVTADSTGQVIVDDLVVTDTTEDYNGLDQ